MERAIILGASRGLGAELVKCSSIPTIGFARKQDKLDELSILKPNFTGCRADFANPQDQDRVIRTLLETSFSKLFYVAGGGPYGRFGTKAWRDHMWAWEVSFVFAARVLFELAQAEKFPQVVLIGSAIAEDAGDKAAASYAAAKHALKGLYCSLKLDYPDWDLKLYSPGYMDTDMLPPNAQVRSGPISAPADIARKVWEICN